MTEDNMPVRLASPMMIRNLQPSLPERGKIKIGEKGQTKTSRSGTEFQPPVKLDHFRVTTLERGPDGNFRLDEDVHAKIGDKPTAIPVRLLYDDPVLNFPTRLACYVGRKLWCSGDGETAMRADDDGKGHHQVTCPCHRSDPAYEGKDRCKMNGNLSVLIDGARGVGGVYKFRTTSYNSIVGLMSTMAFLKSITGGPLANVPLSLIVGPKQVTSPDGRQQTVYIVGLDFDGDMDKLRGEGHKIALDRAKHHVSIENIEREARLLLSYVPQGTPLAGDDSDDIVEEFYPEQVQEAAPATVETMQARPSRTAPAATEQVDPKPPRGRKTKAAAPTVYPLVDDAGEIVAEHPAEGWITAIVEAMQTEGADFHVIWENNAAVIGNIPGADVAQAAYDALCVQENDEGGQDEGGEISLEATEAEPNTTTYPFFNEDGQQVAVYDDADKFAIALHAAIDPDLKRKTLGHASQKILAKNADVWGVVRDHVKSEALGVQVDRAYHAIRAYLETPAAKAPTPTKAAPPTSQPIVMPKLADGKPNGVMYTAMMEEAIDACADREALRVLVERETANLRTVLPGVKRTVLTLKGLPHWQKLGGAPEEWSLLIAQV